MWKTSSNYLEAEKTMPKEPNCHVDDAICTITEVKKNSSWAAYCGLDFDGYGKPMEEYGYYYKF